MLLRGEPDSGEKPLARLVVVSGHELDEVFSQIWHGPRFGVVRRGFRPPIDVVRTEDPDELRVTVDLAGIEPGDVQIAVHERALVIAGRRNRPQTDSQLSYHLLEIEYGPFERRIGLPVDVDPKRARAVYERGLLTVSLPVAPAPPTQARITITVRTTA
jgi:HSP20 family molecular chaperone IbpA